MPLALPANPDLDWLRKAAKKRLAALRTTKAGARLHEAQLAVADAYGFKSWRALKAHVETVNTRLRDRDWVFDAARAGDIEAIRRAFTAGFDPATCDSDGRTIHQIAKERRYEALELFARDVQGRNSHTEAEIAAIQAILRAAQSGNIAVLSERLAAHPDLINALGGDGFQKATAL